MNFTKFTGSLPGRMKPEFVRLPGMRPIFAPNQAMREVHKRFLHSLRKHSGEFWTSMPSAFGGVSGMYAGLRCFVTNHARGRDGKPLGRGVCQLDPPPYFPRYFTSMDIRQAFASVDVNSLAKILHGIWGNTSNLDEITQFLSLFCFRQGTGLIQGAPASTDLFNLYMEHLVDKRMRAFCEAHGICYTRYVDDMLFSRNEPIGKALRWQLAQVVEEAGLQIQHSKTQVLDLKKGPCIINGIGVRLPCNTFMPRAKLRKLRGMLYLFAKKRNIRQRDVAGHYGFFAAATSGCMGTLSVGEEKIRKLYCTYIRGDWFGD